MIYETLQGLCKERKTSFAKVEKTLGFGNGTMQKWNRASPRIDKVKRVADFFGVSVDFLLGREQLSPQNQAIAKAFSNLPTDKQNLVKQYINLMERSD